MNTDSVIRFDAVGADVRIDVRLDVNGRREAATRPEAVTPHPGQVIGGRYELVRVLGRGSMGAVWLAHHQELGEHVALKLLSPTADADALVGGSTVAARFRFEAKVSARLSRKTHHIVRVTDYGQEGPRAYLVMELLEGQTLDAALAQRGPMGAGDVSKLVKQIASGLETAHADGVLHRDLKPANIFLVNAGDGEALVKLLDFGVARQALGECFATEKGLIVGTPGYMSPEQARGASDLDTRADLWSLAAVAYEALTGKLAVEGDGFDEMFANLREGRIVPLRERRSDLPAALERFFERAFASRVENRFTTAAEFARAFEAAAGAARVEPRGAMSPVTLPFPWGESAVAVRHAQATARRRRRGQIVMSLGAAAAVVAVLFGGWRASADRSRVPVAGVAAARAGSMFAAHQETGTLAPVNQGTPVVANPIPAPSMPTDQVEEVSSKTRSHAPSEKTPRPGADYGEFSTYF